MVAVSDAALPITILPEEVAVESPRPLMRESELGVNVNVDTED